MKRNPRNPMQNMRGCSGHYPVAYDIGNQMIGESGYARKVYFALKQKPPGLQGLEVIG